MQRFKVLALIAMSSLFAVGYRAPASSDIVLPINMSVQGDRLFVSDRYAGVHVYDVADAAQPRLMYTIPLDGNTGNAAVGDVLYASDRKSIKAYHLGAETYVEVASIDRKTYEYPPPPNPPFGRSKGYGCSCTDDITVASTVPAASSGSSYATFAVVGDYLYYLDYNQLVALSVADPLHPKEVGRTPINWDVETIYPTEHFLFMGGSRGMTIYSRANPAAPTFIAGLVHVRACDPVVVDGSTAYVTLRGTGTCGGARDELLSIDIDDPASPALVCETDVTTPYGLATGGAGTRLYVSKGDNGFVLFDVTAPDKPVPLASWSEVTRDFIWSGDRLYSMTANAVDIYDVSEPASPSLVATIE